MSMSFTWSLGALGSVDQKCLKKKKKDSSNTCMTTGCAV